MAPNGNSVPLGEGSGPGIEEGGSSYREIQQGVLREKGRGAGIFRERLRGEKPEVSEEKTKHR
jgi:hypothetical protein